MIEPNEYFEVLKSKFNVQNDEMLNKQLIKINNEIKSAIEIGQKTYLDRLVFTYDVLFKEQILLINGFDTYCYREDVKQFLDKIKTIKIIELSRYPRAIPAECLDAIKKAKDLNVFDDFCVVFTDLTDNDYKTNEEREFVARNKDPIVFGLFINDETGIKHDRLYHICSWEDEYCDLTFTKMIEKMSEVGIKDADFKISYDHDYLTELTNMVKENRKKPELPVKHNETFFGNMKKWLSKKLT